MPVRFFLVLYLLAFLGATLFPWVVLQPPGIGSNALTLGQVSYGFLFFGGIWFVYSKRHIPPFDILWKYIFAFLLVLFGTLIWGYIKDKYTDRKK